MLLVWDIHINSKYKNSILSEIREFIYRNDSENNIVFLWDYVYHFSYDRTAILELYNIFVELFYKWKNVYVLTWNHDWISESYIFQEAKISFDIINKYSWLSWWIYFITEPEIFNIDWEDVLFLPYNINISSDNYIDNNIDIEDNNFLEEIQILSNSNNKNERISSEINLILYKFLKKYWNKKLFIIHHYYISDIVFTWQKSRFSFKDVAVSKRLLDLFDNKYFISWHLHQGFVYKNYFCTWSVWATSPIESNHFKFLYTFNSSNLEISSETLTTNFYLVMNEKSSTKSEWMFLWVGDENIISIWGINDKLWSLLEDNLNNFVWWEYIYNWNINKDFPLKKLNLSIYCDNPNYSDISTIIDSEILPKINDIKLKKNILNSDTLAEKLDVSSQDLKTSISDWKNLLKIYLKNKYWESSSDYETLLKEMKIL